MLFSFILAFVFFSPLGNSFLLEKTHQVPLSDLGRLVETQSDRRLSVGLDIGKPGDVSRLAINGIVFDLAKRAPSFNDDGDSGSVRMPGVDGPNPSLSGGLRALTTVQDGSFISMAGSEIVKSMKGCWEIIWKKGDPSGSMVCGFEIDRDYTRNDATLPKGTVYVSFNTWTRESLKEAQGIKERCSKRASHALQKKHEELAKMRETSNLLQMAQHYFNAMSAAEDHAKQPGATRMSAIPSPGDVVRLEDDTYVSTNGQVWTQKLPAGTPVVLGTARMKSFSKEAM